MATQVVLGEQIDKVYIKSADKKTPIYRFLFTAQQNGGETVDFIGFIVNAAKTDRNISPDEASTFMFRPTISYFKYQEAGYLDGRIDSRDGSIEDGFAGLETKQKELAGVIDAPNEKTFRPLGMLFINMTTKTWKVAKEQIAEMLANQLQTPAAAITDDTKSVIDLAEDIASEDTRSQIGDDDDIGYISEEAGVSTQPSKFRLALSLMCNKATMIATAAIALGISTGCWLGSR